MLRVFAPIVAILICSVAAAGAVDLGAPYLDDNLAARSLYDPDRFLTTSGTTIGSTRTLGLTPQVGLGYFTLGREVKTGFEESLHQVHARAGGRVDLFDFFYLSATAKLPVYTYLSVRPAPDSGERSLMVRGGGVAPGEGDRPEPLL